jgi:hypothetical protein
VTDGQEMADGPAPGDGGVWAVQLEPPSLVPRIPVVALA